MANQAQGNQNQGNQKNPGNQPKKQAPTDKIMIKATNIHASRAGYEFNLLAIIDAKDGTAKQDTPFTVRFKDKVILNEKTDDDGQCAKKLSIPYVEGEYEMELIAKITGSSAKTIERFPLPAPATLELESVLESRANGFTAKVRGRVLTKAKMPRSDCEVFWSGNGQRGRATTGEDGTFAFSDVTISSSRAGDKIAYTVNVGRIGYITEKCFVEIPAITKVVPTCTLIPSASGYKAVIKAIVSTKDDRPMANCTIEWTGNQKRGTATTDDNGICIIEDDVVIAAKGGKIFYTIFAGKHQTTCSADLPEAINIEAKCSFSSIKTGYKALVSGKVFGSGNKPLANCPVQWAGGGRNGAGITDGNGSFSFETELGRDKAGDKISYNVNAGFISEKAEGQVPDWKDPDPFWKKGLIKDTDTFLNRYPNWKHDYREILSYNLRTILIFGAALFLAKIPHPAIPYLGCLLIGLFMYIKVDNDGTRGYWRPIFATVLLWVLVDSITFVCTGMILSLIFYNIEALHTPVDEAIGDKMKDKSNPYPWWPLYFAFFMSAVIGLAKLSGYLAPQETVFHSGMYMNEEAIRMYGNLSTFTGVEISNLERWRVILWNELSSALNWFAFAFVLFLYAAPGEILQSLMPSLTPGRFSGIAGFVLGAKDMIMDILQMGKSVKSNIDGGNKAKKR